MTLTSEEKLDTMVDFIFQTMQVSRAQDTVSEGRLALNSKPGSFFCLFKAFSRIIFSPYLGH